MGYSYYPTYKSDRLFNYKSKTDVRHFLLMMECKFDHFTINSYIYVSIINQIMYYVSIINQSTPLMPCRLTSFISHLLLSLNSSYLHNLYFIKY